MMTARPPQPSPAGGRGRLYSLSRERGCVFDAVPQTEQRTMVTRSALPDEIRDRVRDVVGKEIAEEVVGAVDGHRGDRVPVLDFGHALG